MGVLARLAVLLCLLTGCPHLGAVQTGGAPVATSRDSAHASPFVRELRWGGPSRGLLDGLFTRASRDDRLPSEQARPPSQHFLDLIRRAYAPGREVRDVTLQRDVEPRKERPPKAPRPPRPHRK